MRRAMASAGHDNLIAAREKWSLKMRVSLIPAEFDFSSRAGKRARQ
jgi:hypothetical protein